jgi:hypothetical protein
VAALQLRLQELDPGAELDLQRAAHQNERRHHAQADGGHGQAGRAVAPADAPLDGPM